MQVYPLNGIFQWFFIHEVYFDVEVVQGEIVLVTVFWHTSDQCINLPGRLSQAGQAVR